jgi:hypothetical protein
MISSSSIGLRNIARNDVKYGPISLQKECPAVPHEIAPPNSAPRIAPMSIGPERLF